MLKQTIRQVLARCGVVSANPVHGQPRSIRHDGQRPQHLETDKWALSSAVNTLVGIVGVHPYPIDELFLMAAAYEYHRPAIVIDIGTHHGKSARIWHELGHLCSHDAVVHTIDLCDPDHPENPGEQWGKYIRNLPVQKHLGDGCEVATRLIAAQPDANYLLFLDGDHSLETVRRELMLADAITEGCLLLHDTFYQPNATYNHGPYEAIQECLARRSFVQVIHQHAGLPGMTYLRVR